MSSDQHIVILLRLMAERIGRSPGAVGRMATGRGDMYPRLLRGHDITTRRAARIIQWLSDHWPDGAEWPSDIPRPPPRRDAA